MTSLAPRLVMLVTLALAATTTDASAQETRVVPDLLGNISKTVQQVRKDFPDEKFAVVVAHKGDKKVVQKQSPAPGKVLSVGQVIHLYIASSGGVGEALEMAPVLYLPIFLFLLAGGWALRLNATVKRLELATSDDDDET